MLLVLVREFINPAVSRSGLNRCLVRHGVATLASLDGKDGSLDDGSQERSVDLKMLHVSYVGNDGDLTARRLHSGVLLTKLV